MPYDRLIAAYRDTDYHVFADLPFVLRVDEASPPCEALLRRRGVRSAAFLTAWNPMSRPRAPDANALAQERLADRLARDGLATLRGEGRARGGGWTPEESLLILGISRNAAGQLSREFG